MKINPQVDVVIPFRDRGTDPRRAANLDVVQAWWFAHGFNPRIVDDGLEGDAPFNRHRAYNRAVSGNHLADVFVFTEADMLIHPDQIKHAVTLADREVGLVVPFSRYQYLSDEDTQMVREAYHANTEENIGLWWSLPTNVEGSVFLIPPESVMDNCRSIGAVNVVSRDTLRITGGFTEATHGNWYDDNIIEEGFTALTRRPTRFVPGPAVHLYHLPGHKGDHLSKADRDATRHNKNLLIRMRADIRTKDLPAVRRLMGVRA